MASTVTVDTSYLSGRMILTSNVSQFNLADGSYAGQQYTLKICQDSIGGWTIASTTNYTGPTAFPTTANSCTRFLDTWDGTAWTGVIIGTSTAGLPGPQGIQGQTGATGPTGAASTVAGPAGPQGATGAASTVAGPMGPQGVAGAASTVPGPAGSNGSQGIQGATGPAGLTYYLNGTPVSSPVKCNHMTGTTTAAGTYVFNYASMGFTALVGQPQPTIYGTGTNSYIVNIQGTASTTSATVYAAQSSIVTVATVNVSLLGIAAAAPVGLWVCGY